MGDRRDDGQKAEGRVDARLREAEPAHDPGDDERPGSQGLAGPGGIRPGLIALVAPPWDGIEEQKGDERRAEGQQQPHGGQLGRRVEDRKDDEPAGVVGDGEQQQEAHRRVPRAEDDAAHQVGKGDVGRGRHRPAMRDGAEGVGADQEREAEVDDHGPGHAARGGDQRRSGLAAPQRAVLQDHRFPDFLGRHGEEQRHQNVVDQVVEGHDLFDVADLVMQRVFAIGLGPGLDVDADPGVEPERHLDEMMIAVRIGVGPDQRRDRADQQQDRIVADEVPDPVHAVPRFRPPISGVIRTFAGEAQQLCRRNRGERGAPRRPRDRSARRWDDVRRTRAPRTRKPWRSSILAGNRGANRENAGRKFGNNPPNMGDFPKRSAIPPTAAEVSPRPRPRRDRRGSPR